MEEATVGLETGGYYSASKGYSIKVQLKEEGFFFSVIGERSGRGLVPRTLFIPLVGTLNLLGLGVWQGREVLNGVWIESAKKAGFVRIRVPVKDRDKVFIELPLFEAVGLSLWLLARSPESFSYSFAGASLTVSPQSPQEEGIEVVLGSSNGVVRTAVFDLVSLGKLSGLLKEAVLGKIGKVRKVVGLRGYAVVDVEFKTEDQEKQSLVDELKEKLKELAKKENAYWVSLMRSYLLKHRIEYRSYVSLRIGIEGQSDRAGTLLPLPHAWGLSLVFDRLVTSTTSP